MLQLTPQDPETLRTGCPDSAARGFQTHAPKNVDSSTGISVTSTTLYTRTRDGFLTYCNPADIPLSAVLLAWRLLVARSGEEDGVEALRFGRYVDDWTSHYCSQNPQSNNGAEAQTFTAQVAKFMVTPGATIKEAHKEAARLIEYVLHRPDTKVGANNTVYFADVVQSDDEKGSVSHIPYNVCIKLQTSPGQLVISFEWANSQITRWLASRGLQAFTRYLAAILSQETMSQPGTSFDQHPGSPRLVWDLIGPSNDDLNQIWFWNTSMPPTIERCIHDLVSERSIITPDKVAVQAWDGDFTYRELENLSNTIARQLCTQAGVRVGDIVMLVFEKSRWTTPALLGVLKSGAAFVLTDPVQPEARLKAIASQTRAKSVVCSKLQSGLASRIAQEANTEEKCKERKGFAVLVASDDTTLEHAGWGVGASRGFLPVVPPESPMYIIFTSGSTGVPKGVICSHANFVSGAVPRAEAVGYCENSRVFEFASYAFDVSIDCMLCTLMQGGTVCVPSEAGRVDNLGAAIMASGANMAHMTPSVARVLEDPDKVMQSLQVLGLGGEAVSAGDASAWSRLTKVIIAYGPSECTVGCTINHEVSAENTTIGKGKGAVTWIVHPDDHDRLMPVGSVGELLIEGPVVGLGYLGQPEKTAEVFIKDPIWLPKGHNGSKGRRGVLYKTGDLVKYDANGYIVFVGRKDQQVKLRGQRIELSEIEHHLRKNLTPSVKIAAEVVRPNGAEPTLVVFVDEQPIVNGTKTEKIKHDKVDMDEIVKFSPELAKIMANMDNLVGEELPRYMVPAAYIPLQHMPVLPSAKIDRKKLKILGNSMTREQISKLRLLVPKPSRPLNDLERTIRSLWARILNTDVEIGLQDSFFGIGGDSLRAMKLVSAARSDGIVLSVAQVFNNHTLMDMAAVAVVDDSLENSEPRNIAAFSLMEKTWNAVEARKAAGKYCGISESAIEDVYPCTPLQEGLMALSAKFPDSYVAQRVLRLADMTEAQRLQNAFETAARDCAVLRTRIIQVPGHGLQQVVVREPIEWRSGATVEAYLDADRDEPMDLGKPLVRYGLVQSSANKVEFVLTMHHALYDGWSMPLIIDRVNRAYDGLSTERPAEFKHFIRFLTEVDQSTCETYWRQQLEGATAVQFPALPHEGYMTQADSLLEISIPAPPRSIASATTVATIVRGAWALVASLYAGHNDIVFGETLTGRNAPVPGADLIEGPMITTVPVRVPVDREACVAEFLSRIQDQTVRQIPFEHTGLQHIRRVSPDAMEACELRTGLVLHPAGAEDAFDPKYPASRLVPANDAEAAKEALKFNTYALMLVCALAVDGYHVMASFDSRCIDVSTMEQVLQTLKDVTALLCEGLANNSISVGDILQSVILVEPTSETLSELDRLGRDAAGSAGIGAKIDRVWLLDTEKNQSLVPRGAVGEIVVDSPEALSLPDIEPAAWYSQVPALRAEGLVYLHATGQLAKFNHAGKLIHMGRKGKRVLLPSQPVKEDQLSQSRNGPGSLSAKETKLRDIWAQILYLDAVGIGPDDSFFKLGGDSIGAMKLVSEARPAGLKISVAQIFKTKTLVTMAKIAEDISDSTSTSEGEVATNGSAATPFSLLEDFGDAHTFVDQQIKPKLSKTWKIADAYPTRPLQTVAVTGSTQVPRFSMRYEAMYFDDHGGLDVVRLQQVCQEVVQQNEILRTVFATAANGVCYGVVVDDMVAEFDCLDVAEGTDVPKFTHELCNLDIEGNIPEGATFVKWYLIRAACAGGEGAPGALVLRISHAQYDEICLPILLRQLEALYTGKAPITKTIPFSSFVRHTLRTANPVSIKYWKELLAGSAPPTVLRPDLGPMTKVPASGRRHFAVDCTIDISAAATTAAGLTVATIPTAAWALCLARLCGLTDVLFGEVVSGRGTGFPSADLVVGPCWQYVPFRARLIPGVTTGMDLLEAVQEQHAASSAHEGMALSEIAALCCPSWGGVEVDWFDTVVHQDVEHVEDLGFCGLGARMETIYPHQEPLREWKCQAFVADGGRKLTMEIVTFEAWREQAIEVLGKVAACVEELVERPSDVLSL